MDQSALTAWQRRCLECQLKDTRDARLYRRTLAVLEVRRGRPVAQVAEAWGVTPRSVYNWLDAYARDRDPAALRDGRRPGRPSSWSGGGRRLLRDLLGQSPQRLGYHAADWTVPLLRDHLARHAGLWLSDDTARRELDRQGYSWKRSRYVLDPDPEREKKTRPPPPGAGPAAAQRAARRG
jgi:transposase